MDQGTICVCVCRKHKQCTPVPHISILAGCRVINKPEACNLQRLVERLHWSPGVGCGGTLTVNPLNSQPTAKQDSTLPRQVLPLTTDAWYIYCT